MEAAQVNQKLSVVSALMSDLGGAYLLGHVGETDCPLFNRSLPLTLPITESESEQSDGFLAIENGQTSNDLNEGFLRLTVGSGSDQHEMRLGRESLVTLAKWCIAAVGALDSINET